MHNILSIRTVLFPSQPSKSNIEAKDIHQWSQEKEKLASFMMKRFDGGRFGRRDKVQRRKMIGMLVQVGGQENVVFWK